MKVKVEVEVFSDINYKVNYKSKTLTKT